MMKNHLKNNLLQLMILVIMIVDLILIQVMITLPLVFRVLNQGFISIEEEFYYSAQSLGAAPLAILSKVELPLLRKPMALAFLLSIGISLGEVGSLLLFESQDTLSLPLWLYHLVQSYRFQQGQAVGFALLALMGVIYWVVGQWEE